MADTSSMMAAAPGSAGTVAALITTVEATLRNLHAGDPDLPPVTLDSVLDRDLGFDSLGRMELLRTERAFGIDLPADTLQRAETVGDLLKAVQRGAIAANATGDTGIALPAPVVAPTVPDSGTGGDAAQSGAPRHATTLLDVLAWHVQVHPDQTQVVCLHDDTEQRITYRQLADASAAVASGLQRSGVVPRQSVAITFVARPGLMPFHLGAFLAAARAGAPVIPVAIQGHRGILPDGSWWPRRVALQAIVAQSQARQIDLVVMGKRGQLEFDEFLLGSVTLRVLEEIDRDLLLVAPAQA